jgi:hypothetical protein
MLVFDWEKSDLTDNSAGPAEESIGRILARAGDPLRPEMYRSDHHFRVLRSPAIVPNPGPAPSPARFSAVGVLGELVLAVSAAAVIALFMVGQFPPAWNIGASDSNAEATSFASRFAGEPFGR